MLGNLLTLVNHNLLHLDLISACLPDCQPDLLVLQRPPEVENTALHLDCPPVLQKHWLD